MLRERAGVDAFFLQGALLLMVGLTPAKVFARGVSPYLPLNLAPAIERKIELALILANKPIVRRPIPAALVLDALPMVCRQDAALCAEVRTYLDRYMHSAGLTQLQGELALTTGDSNQAMPNAHGMDVDSPWSLTASGYYQPNDYLLGSVGGVAYRGDVTPTGTMLSIGFDLAQLDVGYRDHWYSPSSDGGFLMGTQAPTMPSVTLSNYRPISPLGFSYELFVAQISESDKIAYPGGLSTGHPKLTGLQFAVEPAAGYALAVNRILQYGGGARGQSGLSGLKNALLRNDSAQTPDSNGQVNEFGNQVASITSNFIFPGRVPFEFHFEYAGEDNLYSAGYRLGKIVLAAGIEFPKLGDRYDVGYDVSERQDAWYVHHLYGDGLTNDGHVIGHWFGDERLYGDSPGGYTQSLRAGRRSDNGDYWRLQYRNSVNWKFATYPYKQAHQLALSYSTGWFGRPGSAELNVGRDVFGDSFVRVSASVDLASAYMPALPTESRGTSEEGDGDLYFDVGVNRSYVRGIYWDGLPDTRTDSKFGYHLGFGARRPVSEHGDLGVRIELDEVDSKQLISLRALDYRYRIGDHLALGGFFGAARYHIQLPAWGYYWGAGIQYRNVLPGWDLNADARHYEKISRNNLLTTDRGYGISTVSFRDINGASLYLSHHF